MNPPKFYALMQYGIRGNIYSYDIHKAVKKLPPHAEYLGTSEWGSFYSDPKTKKEYIVKPGKVVLNKMIKTVKLREPKGMISEVKLPKGTRVWLG